MRQRQRVLCAIFVAVLGQSASAEEICPQLSGLLKDPPKGFVSLRGAPASAQRWDSRPFFQNGKCAVWASRSAEAHNIRCTVNDGGKAAKVTKFYEDTKASIARCLKALPEGKSYVRHNEKVDGDGLQGTESSWVYDTDALRFKIDLADYRRTADGSTYNSFSVEYLKY